MVWEEKVEEEEKEEQMKETVTETEEANELESINTNKRQSESKKNNLEVARGAKESSVNANAWNAFEIFGPNMAKFRREVHKSKEQYYNKLTTRCYQLKMHGTTDDDYDEVIQNFHESEIVKPLLDKVKLIEDQWRTLNLWETLQSVNPSPIMKFGRDEPFEKDLILIENKDDDMTFRRSIVLCNIFENLMQTFLWKIGDTLDIEEDICDVVGQLLMKVEKQDRSSLLDCMQSAMMNFQVKDSKQDGDKLRTLLITKWKYNGLNLACILLEQMILDNKDIDVRVSWMRIPFALSLSIWLSN